MKHKIIYLYRDELQIVKGLKAKILISRKYMNKNMFLIHKIIVELIKLQYIKDELNCLPGVLLSSSGR